MSSTPDPIVIHEVACNLPLAEQEIVSRRPSAQEQAGFAAVADAAAVVDGQAQLQAQMEQRARQAVKQLRQAADGLEAGTLTAPQQKAADVLLYRTVARLVLLQLAEADGQ